MSARPCPEGVVVHLAGGVAVPAEVGMIVAAGVTEEPEGGSRQPTSRMRLLGEI